MADFPSAVASNGSLLVAANNVASTLNGGLTAVATSATLASTVHFPVAGGITIEQEALIYTANNTATSVLSGITRGADSTTAAIHSDGVAVYMNVQARYHNSPKDEIIATQQNIKDRFGLSASTAFTLATIVQQISTAGTIVRTNIVHTDNTNGGSHSQIYMETGGASGGDPMVHFGISGVIDWAMGVDNSTSDAFKISKNPTLGTNDYLSIDANGNISMIATGRLYLDGGGDTYIDEIGANVLSFTCGGTNVCQWAATAYNPVGAGSVSTGTATNYWNDISYKTLTDRGCLPWCDDGVELSDGKKVSDLEAILYIKKHPTKKTIHGLPMLDYRTFPKKSYRPADENGVMLPRDSNDEPIGGSDGIEMTMMFGVMIGAFKEIHSRLEKLEKAA